MQITAKSGVSLDQLKERKNKGAKYIELHLFEKDVNSDESIRKILKNIKKSGLSIKAIHIPIDRKYSIEGLITEEGFKIIQNTCSLAEQISQIMQEPIHVVLHQELNLEQLKTWGMYDLILEKLKFILDEYKNIIINLENLPIFDVKKYSFEMYSNYSFQNIELCKELRSDLKTERFGTVLDTCHAISTIKLIQGLVEFGLHENITLEDYFKENKEYVNIIHLSNARGFGYDNNHGIGFDTEEEIELLKELLEYIKEIDFQGILTLEVQEENYLNCVVFEKLKKQIEKIGGI